MRNDGTTVAPKEAEADFCRIVCFHEEKILSLRDRAPAPESLGASVTVLKALAHPGRLAVVRLLAMEECCVCDVANVFSWPISTASQHLAKLKAAGLLKSRTEGKLVFHSLAHPSLPRLLQGLVGEG